MAGRKRKYTDEQMIAALGECKGMVYLAAARIGCSPDAIYDRAKISPDVAAVLVCERGKVIDAAELKLYQAIMNGEPWAIQMCLKTLGKSRGYVERTEITGKDGDPIAFVEVNRAGAALSAPDRTDDARWQAGDPLQLPSGSDNGVG